MLKIGALTHPERHSQFKALLRITIPSWPKRHRLLAVGNQNMGTIGGKICQKPRCLYFRNESNDFPCLRRIRRASAMPCWVSTATIPFSAPSTLRGRHPHGHRPALVALNAKIITTKKAAAGGSRFLGMPNANDVRREQINNHDADES
jgi:CO/xanthine dehydrogenase FAD-binding subunit